MTFHIGSQQAGVLNNVAGDQHNHGGQHAAMPAPPEVLAALAELHARLDQLQLHPADHAQIDAELTELNTSLVAGTATKKDAAERLTRFADTARRAGVLVTAVSGLGVAITTLGRWLGPVGAALLSLVQ